MPAPIIPWQPCNIPIEVQSELNRRKVNRSFNFVKNQQSSWSSDTGDWNAYKGPMVSWIRMCSNSAGHPLTQPPKERFVLYGGKGFYKTYGFQSVEGTPPGSTHQIIGYTPGDPENGMYAVPHTIENSLIVPQGERGNYPIHVPTPEISRIEVVMMKEFFRRATIEWVCFSWKQLEYMTPYFLVPGMTIMVEWGWNHFNPASLVPLYDTGELKKIWKNSYPLYTENIMKSKGNYDVIYGIVSNFNWSIEGNKIICSTEITSKDRLYAGMVKDNSLMVKQDRTIVDGIFQSIKDFVSKDDVVKNLPIIADSLDPEAEIIKLSKKNPKNEVWQDIILPLLNEKDKDVRGMRMPYVYGVFTGRPPNSYSIFGKPAPKDFDNTTLASDLESKLWINMGMIVEILNRFSTVPGGTGQPMFKVDIQNTVICGHPNLISCDPRVLIPNRQAPKFQYGLRGLLRNVKEGKNSDYEDQYVKTITAITKADLKLNQTLSQGAKVCYRNDLDSLINMIRYSYLLGGPLKSYSFPSAEDAQLPASPFGSNGNYVEKDRSGLLTNIYISYYAFKTIIESTEPKEQTYTGIYEAILKLLNEATDNFWELDLVENENTMTITDRKYIGQIKIVRKPDGKPVVDSIYTFDYFDSDSLIKSLKFRPVMNNLQATRVLYGNINNSGSKYSYIDKNDLLDYQFRDSVILNTEERIQGDQERQIEKAQTSKDQLADLISTVQYINQDANDGSFQMTLENGPFFPDIPKGKKEIVKLVLPSPSGQQILRMLLDDQDYDNNPRYCAVQPGIYLELVLLGIGGLRTFQYFLIKNLPEPYSHRNVIFRITDVHQTLESGNWETTIRAQLAPLRKYIINRIPGPNPADGSWPKDYGR